MRRRSAAAKHKVAGCADTDAAWTADRHRQIPYILLLVAKIGCWQLWIMPVNHGMQQASCSCWASKASRNPVLMVIDTAFAIEIRG
jgi:hypothetical protein